MNTSQIANALQVSEHHLAKVIRKLVEASYLQAKRGPKGGISLIKNPNEIFLIEIHELFEGPFNLHPCLLNTTKCPRKTCIFGSFWIEMHMKYYQYLKQTTLSNLINKEAICFVTNVNKQQKELDAPQ